MKKISSRKELVRKKFVTEEKENCSRRKDPPN